MGLLLQQLYNTVDTIIVENFAGEDPLAAVGACGVPVMAFFGIGKRFFSGSLCADITIIRCGRS